jgi:hypothetical protein
MKDEVQNKEISNSNISSSLHFANLKPHPLCTHITEVYYILQY